MIDIVNNAGSVWAPYFGLAVVQNTAFLALVFVALYLFRNATASTKVVVGSIGLAKLLLPPFLPVDVPFSSPEAVRALTPTITSPLLSGAPGPDHGGAVASLGVLGFMFGMWVLCGAGYLLTTAYSTARLAWKLRDATEVADGDVRAVVRDGRVRVYKSERIGMPLCLGIFPRRIFVPGAWDQWTGECRRTVLGHELAHIQRRDGVFLAFQILAQALYFFHPLVWLLNRRVRAYREMACDDASSGFRLASRVEYARRLVEIAESGMQNSVGRGSAFALIDGKQELLKRVAYQMKGETTMPKTKTGMALTALVLIALPFSWYYSDRAPVDSAVNTSSALAADAKATQSEKAGGSSHVQLVRVWIGTKSEVKINDEKTSYQGFRANMEKTVAVAKVSRDDIVIAMACGDGVSMGNVFKIQQQLREMGLMKMTYVTSEGKDLTLILPPLDYKKQLSEVPEKHISTLAVTGGGVVVLQGKKLKTAKLSDEIKKLLAMDDKMILSLQISEKATYGDFMTVLDAAKSANCQRILVGDPTS